MGRPMGLSTLSRIETGHRAVDPDDLVMLAVALDTIPNTLLFESETGTWDCQPWPLLERFGTMSSNEVWAWARGDRGLYEAFDEQRRMQWQEANRPRGVRDASEVTGAELTKFTPACEELIAEARALVHEGVPREVVIAVVAFIAVHYPMPRKSRRKRGM